MSHAPQTSVSLLYRIREADNRVAWNEFAEIYSPLIVAYACHRGLSESDATDVTQEVLLRVLRSASRFEYDPSVGRFSGWLLSITRNCVRQFLRDQPQDRGTGGSMMLDVLHDLPDASNDDELWARSHRLRLIQWASERIQSEFADSTWQAFQRTFQGKLSAAEVARELGISVGAVYIARSRVAARLREVIRRVEGCDDG
jgi:RNA polymerase sigma factor (sigma-70 family)